MSQLARKSYLLYFYIYIYRILKDISQLGLKREKVNRQDILFIKKVWSCEGQLDGSFYFLGLLFHRKSVLIS